MCAHIRCKILFNWPTWHFCLLVPFAKIGAFCLFVMRSVLCSTSAFLTACFSLCLFPSAFNEPFDLNYLCYFSLLFFLFFALFFFFHLSPRYDTQVVMTHSHGEPVRGLCALACVSLCVGFCRLGACVCKMEWPFCKMVCRCVCVRACAFLCCPSAWWTLQRWNLEQ